MVDPSCTAGDCAHELNDNAAGLTKFLKWAVTVPDVYFVTYSDLVRVGMWVRVCGWGTLGGNERASRSVGEAGQAGRF